MRFIKRDGILILAALLLTIASLYDVTQKSLTDFLNLNFREVNNRNRHRNLALRLASTEVNGLLSSLDEAKDIFCNQAGLRIKVLGNDQNNSTYPEAICNADNSLMANSTPSDWSVCFRSRIDESVYDVFILDFYKNADDYLVALAERIRNRFPQALIINLKHWHPIDIGYPGTYGWTSVGQWAEAHGFGNMKDSLGTFMESSLPWARNENPSLENFFQQATKNAKGWNIFKGAESDADLPTGREYQELLHRRSWMYDDWDTRNKYGDLDVARGIFDLMKYINQKIAKIERTTTVNDWNGNDDPPSCFM